MGKAEKISALMLSLLFLIASPVHAQYWQQYVEYDMNIVLDTEDKTLSAQSDLLYVNNSPDTLDQILMQLYHNAFNEGTIAQQVWEDYGDAFDVEKDWTGIKINDVQVDSTSLTYIIRDDTILDILFPAKIYPGDTLEFFMDWTSLIHPNIDRSGYEGDHFSFAQWYPKFVVYDENGWHDDPFGDWGEFYGEFGNFMVRMDVPAEQIVASTGIVTKGDPGWSEVAVDTSKIWEEWVENFEHERDSLLSEMDSSARRTVTFFAENVHDFAWQCSKDYVYEYGEWNDVAVHALFNLESGEDWTRDVVNHGISSLEWLSTLFGSYPWPQMTITEALFGGGMEYPMLIMDGSESEGLIVHEIGHNWFYGMFANDELDDAWLDEGFTSFQTLWYIEKHYPDNDYSLSRKYITKFESEHLPRVNYLEKDLKPVIEYMLSVKNEPMATHSFDFTNYRSYSINVYDKASTMLYSLKEYLGEERFLAGMREYYERWAMKHVNEDRFIKAMEVGSGVELDWFFDQWLHTTKHVDYKLVAYSTEQLGSNQYETSVQVENLGGLFVPISATVYGENGDSYSATLKEFRYRDSGEIIIESAFKPVRVELDANNVFMDVDKRNNRSWKDSDLRYNFKDWENYPSDRNLYLWEPRFGYNDVAGLGLGLRIDRVYRIPDNYWALEVDHNLESGNPDVVASFQHTQGGLPFKATVSGTLGSWKSLGFASLNYEINWAKIFWKNPVHYLTLEADHTDATHAFLHVAEQTSFSRFGLHYELQDDLWGGSYGFSARFQYSPAGLGTLNANFNQEFLMSYWSGNIAGIGVVNRSNLMGNSSLTPDLVLSRPSSCNQRESYLDRTATSLHGIDGIDMMGIHYFLVGGGRMRGYTDTLDLPVNYLWSNNLDLSKSPRFLKALGLSFTAFLDVGQSSSNASYWQWLGDVGLGIEYNPSWKRTNWVTTLIRPFNLKLEFPLVRMENDAWVPAYDQNLWVFSISN